MKTGPELAVLVVVTAGLCLQAPPAAACSFAPTPAGEAVNEGDAAFVGRLLFDRPTVKGGVGRTVTYTFLVDWVVKGSIGRTVEVVSGSGGGDCGLRSFVDDRRSAGIVLTQFEGGWTSSIAKVYEPGELLDAVDGERYIGTQPNPRPEPFESVPKMALIVAIVTVVVGAVYRVWGSRKRKALAISGLDRPW